MYLGVKLLQIEGVDQRTGYRIMVVRGRRALEQARTVGHVAPVLQPGEQVIVEGDPRYHCE